MLLPYGLKELVRTGRVAMVRGGTASIQQPSQDGAYHRTAPPAKASRKWAA